jgi:hypothetical protein
MKKMNENTSLVPSHGSVSLQTENTAISCDDLHTCKSGSKSDSVNATKLQFACTLSSIVLASIDRSLQGSTYGMLGGESKPLTKAVPGLKMMQ